MLYNKVPTDLKFVEREKEVSILDAAKAAYLIKTKTGGKNHGKDYWY